MPATKKKIVKRKKPAPKRAPRRKPAAKPKTKPRAEKPVGRVTHFYGDIKVAVVKFSKIMSKGTEIRFSGATTDFKQKLDSMQYEHKPLARAPKGRQVGVKVKSRVRQGDKVYAV